MTKFIRIEDGTETGVYRSDVRYHNFDYTNFIYMIGIMTRAPFDNMVASLMKKTHPRECRVEHGFHKFIRTEDNECRKEYQFAWKKEFFLRMAKGEFTDNERSFWNAFCRKIHDSKEFELPNQSFLELLFDNGFMVYEITAPAAFQTDQQCVFEKSKAKKELILEWKTLLE